MLAGINKPFIDSASYNDAAFSIMGRNYLKLGFLETKFGPVWDINPKQPKPYLYYLHHPPLVPILVALSFKVFGVHEWSARIIPVFFFFGSMVFIYMLAAKLYDKQKALLSALFSAIMPLSFFYGKMVSHESVTLFFSLSMLYFYLKQLEDKRYFKWMVFGQIFGLFSGWPAFYMSALIFIHYRLFIKKSSVLKDTFSDKGTLLVALPALFFVIWIAYSKWLTGYFGGISDLHLGKLAYQNLFSEFIMMSGFGNWLSISFINRFFLTIAGFAVDLIPIPLLILSVLGSMRIDLKRNIFLAGLFIFGLIHIVLFSNGGSLVHPFWIYYFIPAIAISSSIAFDEIKNISVKMIVLMLVIVFSLYSIINEPKNLDVQRLYIWGKDINYLSKASDTIGTRDGYIGPQIEFYSDRYFDWLMSEPNKYDYIFLYRAEAGAFDENIFKNNPTVELGALGYSYHLVDQKSRGLKPAYSRNINFDDQIIFSGYSFKRERDFIFATYFWGILGRPKENYEIFVHFEDMSGKYAFGQDHFFKDGLIDMSRLSAGDKIIESYFIDIPQAYRDKRFNVYIGVYSPTSGQRLHVLNMSAMDNRAFLGTI